MKKQKISLQLRKQKISKISGQNVTGGFFTFAVDCTTIQPFSIVVIDCVTQNCEPIDTTFGFSCELDPKSRFLSC